MEIVLLFARLLLAAVFVVAGVAKLADREGSRRAIADFGVPAALAEPLGILLPLAELAVAAALIPTSTAFWGAVGALLLLLVFIVGIGANLARGRKPDCHCFGQIHSAPAGWSTLARNGVLAAVSALLVWRGLEGEVGPSMVGWIGALSVSQLVLLAGGTVVLALLAAQWLFLFELLRQNGRLFARLNAVEESLADADLAPSENGAHSTAGLPVGSPAPAFALEDLDGEEVTLDGLRARGKPVMLLFTDPNCGPCADLMPEVGRWQQQYAEQLTISIVGRGTAAENDAEVSEHGVENVLLQEDWEVADAYEVDATPGAVVISSEGLVGSPVAHGPDEVETLLAQAVGGRLRLPLLHPTAGDAGEEEDDDLEGPEVGEPAPEIRLPDLEGREIGLDDYRGEATLVVFCSPDCGFCEEMLPKLRESVAASPDGAPKVLLVSDGTAEENEAMTIGSPLVLDQTYAVWEAYGVTGTPSAVLVDAEGRIASEMALGTGAVLELVKTGRSAA